MIEKIKIPAIILISAALVFSLYEVISVDNVSHLDSYILDNFLLPIIVVSIITTSFFHYLKLEFRTVFQGNNTYWLSRLKLAGRILITFPGLVLFYHLLIKSTISFVNRKVGIQKEIVIKGNLTDKSEMTSKGTTRYYFDITDRKQKDPITVKVGFGEYNSYNTGDPYEIAVKLGYLGYMYKEK